MKYAGYPICGLAACAIGYTKLPPDDECLRDKEGPQPGKAIRGHSHRPARMAVRPAQNMLLPLAVFSGTV